MASPRLLLVAIALVLSAATVACGGDGPPTATSPPSPSSDAPPPLAGSITVFAASSLIGAFDEIGAAFEAEHPALAVTINYGASSTLVAQINEGAPADVFASADEANMDKLTDAGGHTGNPVTFAHNELALIVGPGNPQDVRSVEDLASPDLIVVLCGPHVPIGAYSQQVFDKAGVSVTPASYEENVKAVVTKVTSGEADAGVVYATDVQAAGERAEGVAIPVALNVTATYPMVVTEAATNPAAAAFVEFAIGPAGQAVLARYGFGPR
jgi:molybdate transport system substrate-binding protein